MAALTASAIEEDLSTDPTVRALLDDETIKLVAGVILNGTRARAWRWFHVHDFKKRIFGFQFGLKKLARWVLEQLYGPEPAA